MLHWRVTVAATPTTGGEAGDLKDVPDQQYGWIGHAYQHRGDGLLGLVQASQAGTSNLGDCGRLPARGREICLRQGPEPD